MMLELLASPILSFNFYIFLLKHTSFNYGFSTYGTECKHDLVLTMLST